MAQPAEKFTDLKIVIEGAWEGRESLSTSTQGEVRDAVETSLNMLDAGQLRIAEKMEDGWIVNQWLKKAVLLSFVLNSMQMIEGNIGGGHWYDKVKNKFQDWTEEDFKKEFKYIRNLEYDEQQLTGVFRSKDSYLMK